MTLIDADLQQRPEIVRDMVEFLEKHEEYDCVAAYQEKRREIEMELYRFSQICNRRLHFLFYLSIEKEVLIGGKGE